MRGSWRTRYLWFSPPFGRVCGLLRCCVLGAAVDALRQGLCHSTFGAALLHTQVCTALSAPGLAGRENLSARQHSTGGDGDAHEHLAHERRRRGAPPVCAPKRPLAHCDAAPATPRACCCLDTDVTCPATPGAQEPPEEAQPGGHQPQGAAVRHGAHDRGAQEHPGVHQDRRGRRVGADQGRARRQDLLPRQDALPVAVRLQ